MREEQKQEIIDELLACAAMIDVLSNAAFQLGLVSLTDKLQEVSRKIWTVQYKLKP